MKGAEIREKFLKYFEDKGHKRLSSSSLIPADPSVLLTLAGMLQFKPIFLGEERPKYKRVTTCQKCMRMIDIDRVGRTLRHHTFFEMLGNFSFGDYFKKDAIFFAWEFLTKELGLDRSKLYIAVFERDDEAYNIWVKDVGLTKDKLFRLNEDNNFWAAGDTGPCGPCSEIYWDTGEQNGCKKPDCAPGCDCDRFLELWNLVFIEFNRDKAGKLHKLPSKSIDTGMGLERIASVMQGVHSNFDTDLIKPVVDEVRKLMKSKPSGGPDPSQVIADHIRAITFLSADGVIASNEGRGYVLRRLIRRASRFGRQCSIKGSFLSALSKIVIDINGSAYPELKEKQGYISKLVTDEENSFGVTLEQGLKLLSEIEGSHKGDKVIPGKDAFKLHDTFGFPLELLSEILSEDGFTLDQKGFEEEMNVQKERARAAGLKKERTLLDPEKIAKLPPTKFVGYESLQADAKVLEVFLEDDLVVLDRTPFYPEGGGQVGDQGSISSSKGEVRVLEAFGAIGEVIVHRVKGAKAFSLKTTVKATVDSGKRFSTANHHTSTHLLHKALGQVLGEGVRQTGSFVCPDYFRFDYTKTGPLTDDEIAKVEAIVNEKIREHLKVEVFETTLSEAKKMGATALFGEKYGQKVRVIKIGNFSLELCAGTHVSNTGAIELFKIKSDSSLASGVRRIEAVAGSKVIEQILSDLERVRRENIELICACKAEEFKKEELGGTPLRDFEVFEIMPEEVSTIKRVLRGKDIEGVGKFMSHLRERNARLKDRIASIKRERQKLFSKKLNDDLPILMSKAREISGLRVIVQNFYDVDKETLRALSDKAVASQSATVVLFSSESEDKPIIVCRLTDDLVKKGVDAIKIVRAAAKVMSGGGGGKPHLADAGGKDAHKLSEAVEAALLFIKEVAGGISK